MKWKKNRQHLTTSRVRYTTVIRASKICQMSVTTPANELLNISHHYIHKDYQNHIHPDDEEGLRIDHTAAWRDSGHGLRLLASAV